MNQKDLKRCAILAAMMTSITAMASLPKVYGGGSTTNLYHVKPLERTAIRPSSEATGIQIIGANLNKGDLVRGLYSFNAVSGTAYTPLVSDIELNGGGVYANGKYYALIYDYDSNSNLTLSKWLRYDPEVWSLEAEVDCPLSDYTYIAFDRAFDSSTGIAYALSSDATGTTSELSTTDLATGRNTLVGNFSSDVSMICLACDGKGKLYSLDTSGILYSVDPLTAVATKIGDTNIMDDYVTDYTQSMVYDQETKMIYWAEFHTEGFTLSPKSALYKINPANAVTEKVMDFPTRAEFSGLYIPDQGLSEAPAAPALLSVEPKAAGSLEMHVSFTAPTHTNGGVALPADSALSFEVIVDSETIDILDGILPGESVTTDYYEVGKGLHTLKVRGENSAGIGKNAAIRFYAGYDVPAAPSNLKMTVSGENVTLTWDLPVRGSEGGDIRSPYTYNVKRLPDGVAVATGITENRYSEKVESAGWYYYSVTASSPDGEGPAAESEGAVVGEFSVPYKETFSDETSANLYTIKDFNEDGRTWGYSSRDECMRYSYSISNSANDAMITPAIRLEKSKGYKFSFTSYKYLAGYNEIFDVYFGNTADLDKMTKLGRINSELTVDSQEFSYIVAPEVDGPYYFAFHALSGNNQMFIYIDNISVEVNGSSDVPAAVSDLTATACGDEYRDIEVRFTVPTQTLGGDPLEALSKVELFRGSSSTAIYKVDDPTPGSVITYTDKNMSMGSYEYRVISTSASGESEAVKVTVYAGVDIPEPPTEFKLTLESGKPMLTWKAPERGVKGGSLSGLLSYELVRMVNMSENERIALTGEATSYEDSYDTETQAYLYYALIAKTTAGEADAVYTDGIVVGLPYTAPYSESFADATPTTNPWFISRLTGTGDGWSIVSKSDNMDPTVRPEDGDGGMAQFDGYHSWTGTSRLISPRISISHMTSPKLIFSFYHYVGNTWSGETGAANVKETMQVEVSKDGGDYEEVPGALYSLYADKNGWETIELSLKDYRDSEYINISFKGISGYTYNMYLDNIQVTATYRSNVAVGAVTAPESGDAGSTVTINAVVENLGTLDATSVKAMVKSNGETLSTVSVPTIKVGASADVEIPVELPIYGENVKLQVEVSMPFDENSLDNVSKEFTIDLIGGLSGLERIETSTLKVRGICGGLSYSGLASGERLSVYTVSGARVAATMAESGEISLLPGVYVVRSTASRGAIKVIVKK